MQPSAEPLHSRIDLACEQLDVAIELFFAERSFVSVLTLAGAAEEVFGTEVKNRGGKNILAKRHAERQRLYQRVQERRIYYPNLKLRTQTWVEFRDKENYARNAAKHIAGKDDGRPYDPFFRANPRSTSVGMVLRALQNQELLALPRSELGLQFFSWYLASMHIEEP